MKRNSKFKPNLKTALKASPTLFRELFKGNFSFLKYYIKNGIIERFKFAFPSEDMVKFFNSLPNTNFVENKYLKLRDKVAIMTYDDVFDEEIYSYERSKSAKSTSFLLSYKTDKKINRQGLDLQLHFDNRYSSLVQQKEKIRQITGKMPLINRNHSLWWSYTHLELLNLALHGIKVDSTLAGNRPFRLCVQGKLLPIWEVPFNVCDSQSVISGPVRIPRYMKALFAKKITPIVGLFHPHLKHKSGWKDFYKYADKYNYKLMTMTEFYNKYLKGK